MTSETLNQLPDHRARLFAMLARLDIRECLYPALGQSGAKIIQQARLADARTLTLILDPQTG